MDAHIWNQPWEADERERALAEARQLLQRCCGLDPPLPDGKAAGVGQPGTCVPPRPRRSGGWLGRGCGRTVTAWRRG